MQLAISNRAAQEVGKSQQISGNIHKDLNASDNKTKGINKQSKNGPR